MEDSVSLVKNSNVEDSNTQVKLNFFQKLNRWDHQAFLGLYRENLPKYELFIMKFISISASLFFWISLSLIIYIFADYTNDYKLFEMVSGLFNQSIILFYIAKYLVKRPRPFVKYESVKPRDKSGRGYSMPSGHTTFFMIFCLLFTFYFNSPWLLIFTIVFCVPLAYSRIKLGVHYPLDTIFGIIFGILAFLLFWFVTQGFWMFIYDHIVEFFQYVF
jgi:membrane-associated phospholipid phosphatase